VAELQLQEVLQYLITSGSNISSATWAITPSTGVSPSSGSGLTANVNYNTSTGGTYTITYTAQGTGSGSCPATRTATTTVTCPSNSLQAFGNAQFTPVRGENHSFTFGSTIFANTYSAWGWTLTWSISPTMGFTGPSSGTG